MSNLKKALKYLDRGWSIIPLWSPKEVNKCPGILKEIKQKAADKSSNEEEYQIQYHELLTKKCKAPLNVSWTYYQTSIATRNEVIKWFTDFPDANIGIITGNISGITVLDLDTQEAIDKAEYAGLLKNNLVSKTGKGYHVFFQYSENEMAKTSSKKKQGFDIRGDGGYIVGPPSEHGSGEKYEWLDGQSLFDIGLNPFPIDYIIEQTQTRPRTKNNKILSKNNNETTTQNSNQINIIDRFNLSANAKSLIVDGNKGRYPSRSEADMAVVCHLLSCGANDFDIIEIFKTYSIGDKYRTSNAPNKYLQRTIEKAKELVNLTPEEISNPLFTSKAITKHDRGYSLNIVNFQEYVCSEMKLKLNIKTQGIYRYNGKQYVTSSKKEINILSQNILNNYRNIFRRNDLDEFIHYMDNNNTLITEGDIEAGKPYICFKNCMLNTNSFEKVEHTDEIFTTSIFDYDYNPKADCPRFKQFLNEIFENDESKIRFIQEAAGYCLHRSLPIPALIFLVGNGCNGKSVLLDVLTSLFGSDNVANVNLSELSDEKMIITLVDKMMNVSPESPTNRRIDTDKIKSVASGDLVTGRAIYNDPFMFRPYAKHFIAMNEFPIIKDKSHGMSRRVFVVEFNRTFTGKEINTGLRDELRKELPGIFNFVLAGYKRMRSNGFTFENGEKFQNVAQDALHRDDPIKVFIEDYFQSNNVDRAKLKDIYSTYEGNRQDPLGKKQLKEKLISFGYKVEYSTKDGNSLMVLNRRD